MERIHGINFAPFAGRGKYDESAYKSLTTMVERTCASHVILTPAGLQANAHEERIDFSGEGTPSDDELVRLIQFAQSLGLKVILKPTVNCANGEWRAWINFFDEDVPCEPKWRNWFASHEAFQMHYAGLADKSGCVMFIAGCEMVLAQRRETEWRHLVQRLRTVYRGPISYNTDKYQEHNVSWWDCVDVISSSGYYPLGHWPQELERIQAVVKRYKKPFFFAEAGCMSTEGSPRVPNDWGLAGGLDLDTQRKWYIDMVSHLRNNEWVEGVGLWSWPLHLKEKESAVSDKGYSLYAKPAEEVVKQYFHLRSPR